MKKKKSVLLYLDNYTPAMKGLSYEQKGMLFDAIISYAGGIAEVPVDLGMLSLALDPIKAAIDRDNEKYIQVCERNQKNGLKGGKPKQTQTNPEEPSGLITNPDKPDKDNDKDKDTDTIQIKKEEEQKKKKAPPKKPKEPIEEIEYPEWLNQELFNGFLEDRKARKVVNTPRAITGLITALGKCCNGNYDLQAPLIEKAITNAWKSFFPLKPDEIPTVEEEAPQYVMHSENIEKAAAKCAAIRLRREAGEII
jgi:hypothetical protein